jgi:hypothetical protein
MYGMITIHLTRADNQLPLPSDVLFLVAMKME